MKQTFYIVILCVLFTLNTTAQNNRPLLPADFFPGFPKVAMGMQHGPAKAAIEKTRSGEYGFRASKTEMVWNGTFDGVSGRATLLLKPRTGVWEIAVVLFAMDDRAALYDRYLKKLIATHGKPSETHDDAIAISNVWRLDKGLAIELRSPKDVNSPVVDIHWVHSAAR